MVTAYGQMRLVSAFEIANHTLSMGLTAGMAGMGLWLWSQGAVGVGAVAAATAMARIKRTSRASFEGRRNSYRLDIHSPRIVVRRAAQCTRNPSVASRRS